MSAPERVLLYIVLLCLVGGALAIASVAVSSVAFAWCCVLVGWAFIFEGWRQLRRIGKR